MDFLKAVILAVLIHILAPLVVEYVEGSLSVNRTTCRKTEESTAA